MKVEPRAWIHINEVYLVKQCRIFSSPIGGEFPDQTPLYTLADVLAAMREPSEAMWGGLARDIVFWLDTTDKRTPRSLFKFLGNVGREVPEWIKTHMEMANLDHAISKGTRATIIFLAMLDQFDRDQGSAT